MDALYHARSTAKKWGGTAEEYLRFHDWFDESAMHLNDKRHRMLRHHSLGIQQLIERFGAYYTNSVGKSVPMKQIGEQHVVEDIGFIPSFSDWVREIPVSKWMRGKPGRFTPKEITVPVTPKKWWFTMWWYDSHQQAMIYSPAHHNQRHYPLKLFTTGYTNISDATKDWSNEWGHFAYALSWAEGGYQFRIDHAEHRPTVYVETEFKQIPINGEA